MTGAFLPIFSGYPRVNSSSTKSCRIENQQPVRRKKRHHTWAATPSTAPGDLQDFYGFMTNSLLGARENGNMKNAFVIEGPEKLHPNGAMTPRKLLAFAILFMTVVASV